MGWNSKLLLFSAGMPLNAGSTERAVAGKALRLCRMTAVGAIEGLRDPLRRGRLAHESKPACNVMKGISDIEASRTFLLRSILKQVLSGLHCLLEHHRGDRLTNRIISELNAVETDALFTLHDPVYGLSFLCRSLIQDLGLLRVIAVTPRAADLTDHDDLAARRIVLVGIHTSFPNTLAM